MFFCNYSAINIFDQDTIQNDKTKHTNTKNTDQATQLEINFRTNKPLNADIYPMIVVRF